MKKIAFFLFTSFILSGCKDSTPQFDASGAFEADEILISAQQTGQILALKIHEGEVLTEKQLIGKIDVTNFQLQRAQVEASVGSLQEKLNTASPQNDVVKRQVFVTQSQIASLQKEKTRIENLLKADAATPKQLDDINAQIDPLQKQLAVYQQQMESSNSTVNTQNRAILSERNPLQKSVAVIDEQIRKGNIVNPVKGTVLTQYAFEGEMTSMGKVLYKIADLDTITLRAYISGTQLSKIKIGQVVTVKIDAGDKLKAYKGTIRFVSDKAEFTPKTIQTKNERENLVYATKISVPNDGFLKIGMYGEIILNEGMKE